MTLGMPVKLACDYVGISVGTYYEWMARADPEKKGKNPPKPEHIEFANAVKQAISKGTGTLLARIRKAAEDPTKWQAAAWLLERRFPEEFARPARQTIELSGRVDSSVKVEETTKNAAEKLSRFVLAEVTSVVAKEGSEPSDAD
jgi:hypothetical protein